jgi:hypothetical protein
MATTTPNYGWTVPTSGDLVKDGATAIETLGDAIDASMNTALGTKKAMGVLLSTVSFSAVASQSFNDVFSADYDNYKVVANIISLTGTNDQLINFRMRVAGADNSSNNYENGEFYVGLLSSTAFGSGNSVLLSSGKFGSIRQTEGNYTEATFFDPFNTAYTRFIGNSGGAFLQTNAVALTVTTSYTGFSVIPSSGNMTGTVSIYGLAK